MYASAPTKRASATIKKKFIDGAKHMLFFAVDNKDINEPIFEFPRVK